MESIQSYYIHKRKCHTEQSSTTLFYCIMRAMRTMLEIDEIRNQIIFKKFPKLAGASDSVPRIRLSDLFETRGSSALSDADETNNIINAVNDIQGNVVIPIKMRHNRIASVYQYIILDKTMMEVYTIDPSDQKKDVSNPCHTIANFFGLHGYHMNAVLSSAKKPAINRIDDPFSQSWSLMILMEALDQLYGPMKCIGVYHYPDTLPDKVKYSRLIAFYKNCMKDNPELEYELENCFIEAVNHYKPQILDLKYGQKMLEEIIDRSPIGILLSITMDDILLNR